MATPSECLVVSYHYVRSDGRGCLPPPHALDAGCFAEQVAALQRSRVVLEYATLLDALDGRCRLAEPGALLTFDDGLLDHYTTVFPILRSRGATGVFFVPDGGVRVGRVLNVQKAQLLLAALGGVRLLEEVQGAVAVVGGWTTGRVPGPEMYRYDTAADAQIKHLLNYELPYEIADLVLDALFRRHIGEEADVAPALYLSESMIREMARAGMTFGYHTRRHRVLARLGDDEQRSEVQDGVRWIRDLTGQSTVPFCFPHGHARAYTPQTVRIVRQAGYAMAFTAVRGVAQPTRGDRFELPRYDTRDVPTPTDARLPSGAPARRVAAGRQPMAAAGQEPARPPHPLNHRELS